MGDTFFHRYLFRSMVFLRMVTLSVFVLTPTTNIHHFHVKWISDPKAEANPSHGTVIPLVDEKGTVLRESQVYIPCLIRSSVVKVFSGEIDEAYPVCITEFLSKLTYFVSFMVVSEDHCFVAFRWLIQISLDLLMRQRPPRKPPWNQPTTEDGDAIMMRIRRSDQQQVWVYATITKLHISFFRRVPKSRVLRCNGWIADFDFRKRKRWCIDKKKMFPKLENHTRLTDTTKATKHIIRIAALELFCFFVTNLFDCVHTLMF
ncbi:hypothetical protein ISN45_Aa06g014220 [Arabidopsis thaliana x Arabidopsis arenosa]|uniref:Uncharacterized protein n=1 Tax=Arabidopsis thaliana x Arabidopsis arenosa TaxID=1240361 RepID=A0A8T1YVV9_9BRAS|nr:hypothetical protein ISN45_Aa06g014220 [Arabidopsis thaliana x Arabidopsis arenosa]